MPENRSAFLAATLARALPDAPPHRIAQAVTAMQAAARAAKRWSETECSYPLTDAQQRRGDRRVERLARAARDALDYCGNRYILAVSDTLPAGPPSQLTADRCTLRFGGDPRGPCAWLHVSDMLTTRASAGAGDGWSADDGFAIYA